jgi:carboxylesterase
MAEANVISGAEAIFLPGNSIGILISHGFNGTPQSVQYLAYEFAKYGYTVYAPRLKGHGTTIEEMEKTTYQDWIADIQEAYLLLKQTCHHIFVMGQSMGGALALDLATKAAIDGVLTINAALSVPEYEALARQSAPRFITEGKPDIKDAEATEITYEQVPLNAVLQLLETMKVAKQGLPDVTCPIKIFVSPEDHVVPAHCSYNIFDSVNSSERELVALDHSYHVASLDYDKDRIIQHTIDFIQNHTQNTVLEKHTAPKRIENVILS